MPYFDSDNTSVIYFVTPTLANGSHTIDVTVTAANDSSPYIIDYFLIVPSGGENSGIDTTRAVPPATASVPIITTHKHSVPVGAIVGGVVGGIIFVIVILLVTILCCLSLGTTGVSRKQHTRLPRSHSEPSERPGRSAATLGNSND